MKWIRIKDRKPRKGQAVLCHQACAYKSGRLIGGSTIEVGCRIDPIPTTKETYEFVSCPGGSVLWRVSHWMPLPRPPSNTTADRTGGPTT